MLKVNLKRTDDGANVYILTLEDANPPRGRPYSNLFCMSPQGTRMLADTIQVLLDIHEKADREAGKSK